MLRGKLIQSVTKVLLASLAMSFITMAPAKKAYADAFEVVTLGADLTQDQKNQMLDYFKVKKDEVNVIEVTSAEEKKYLGSVASPQQLGTKAISCSYIQPTSKGGLNIQTNNLYWVTEGMIRNALITAGIQNANVNAAAPFKVSGTAALTGIIKGFENSKSGEKIDEDKKQVANEEIVVTGDLGEKVGQDKAADVINNIKTEVVKEKPKDEKQIEKIVDKQAKKQEVELSQEDREKITQLMNKINDLDLDFNKIKGSLKDASNKLQEVLGSDEAQGIFHKIGQFFKDIWSAIGDLFSSDDKETAPPTTTTENTTKNGSNNGSTTGSEPKTN